MSISTTARGKLTKVIETLATINLCFDDFIKDPALLPALNKWGW